MGTGAATTHLPRGNDFQGSGHLARVIQSNQKLDIWYNKKNYTKRVNTVVFL